MQSFFFVYLCETYRGISVKHKKPSFFQKNGFYLFSISLLIRCNIYEFMDVKPFCAA